MMGVEAEAAAAVEAAADADDLRAATASIAGAMQQVPDDRFQVCVHAVPYHPISHVETHTDTHRETIKLTK